MGEKIKPDSAELRYAMKKPRQPKPEPAILTIAEACAYLRISKWALYQLIRKGQLASVKIGRRRLIPRTAIEQLMRQLRAETDEGG